MRPAFLVSLLISASVQHVHSLNVYLYPARSYAAGINSLQDVTTAVSRHLGLEMFERLEDGPNSLFVEEDFVGKGATDGILLTMHEVDAQAVLPSEFKDSSAVVEVDSPKNVDSLDSVVSTYLHRAARVYSSIFSPVTPSQLTAVDSLTSFFETTEGPAFAALQVSKLQAIRQRYGPSSEEYQTFAAKLQQFLEDAIHERPNLNIAILTFGSPTLEARHLVPRQSQSPLPGRPQPQEPIGAISACFTTLDACNNGTNSCSGRGSCVEASKAGRTCFVCACGVTKSGKGSNVKTETWVGQSCERKDISGPFVLLTGTVIVLLIVGVGSISLLYTVGDQALPSILLATAVQTKKD